MNTDQGFTSTDQHFIHKVHVQTTRKQLRTSQLTQLLDIDKPIKQRLQFPMSMKQVLSASIAVLTQDGSNVKDGCKGLRNLITVQSGMKGEKFIFVYLLSWQILLDLKKNPVWFFVQISIFIKQKLIKKANDLMFKVSPQLKIKN